MLRRLSEHNVLREYSLLLYRPVFKTLHSIVPRVRVNVPLRKILNPQRMERKLTSTAANKSSERDPQ